MPSRVDEVSIDGAKLLELNAALRLLGRLLGGQVVCVALMSQAGVPFMYLLPDHEREVFKMLESINWASAMRVFEEFS